MDKASMCMYFSATGVIFLTLVGITFSSSAIFYAHGVEDFEVARASVWGADLCYAIAFVASLLILKAQQSEAMPKEDCESGVDLTPIQNRGYLLMSTL